MYTSNPRALVADDHWFILEGLKTTLKRDGYDVVACDNGLDAVHHLMQEGPFDVAFLDVVMPQMTGFEVLEQVRAAGQGVPVIMLSGQCKEPDRIKGLNLGADDFLGKPFSHRELLARAAAVRRRAEATRPLPKRIRVGSVVADFETREAVRQGDSIHFTPLEWAVLRHLAYRNGKAVSRAEFNIHVLKIPPDIPTRTIDRHAYALRKKIDETVKKPHHILAVKGLGYRLNDFELLA